MVPTLLCLPLLLWAGAAARSLARNPRPQRFAAAAVGLIGLTVCLWLPAALLHAASTFGLMSMLCGALFLGLPLLSLGMAWGQRGPGRLAAALLALGLVGVGLYAFRIEPFRLQTPTLRVESPDLESPVRVVLLADVQTRDVGDWEARAFRAAAALEPDLVLFTGDHVQLPDGPAFEAQAARFAQALRDSGLAPRLGMFAVEGDVDPRAWARVFQGTSVRVLDRSTTLSLDGLTLTALSPDDSRSPQPPVPRVDGFHIVMGHSPDFALARPPADLLLAGHTHGGQVQLPGFGPLLTFAAVPRDWASGHTALPWGGDLVVSNGIGLERQDAPPLRFFCPPEIVVVDLVPATIALRED